MKLIARGEIHAAWKLKKGKWYYLKGKERITQDVKAIWIMQVLNIKIDKEESARDFFYQFYPGGAITFRHAPLFNYRQQNFMYHDSQDVGKFKKVTTSLKDLRAQDFDIYETTVEEIMEMAPQFMAELL